MFVPIALPKKHANHDFAHLQRKLVPGIALGMGVGAYHEQRPWGC